MLAKMSLQDTYDGLKEKKKLMSKKLSCAFINDMTDRFVFENM